MNCYAETQIIHNFHHNLTFDNVITVVDYDSGDLLRGVSQCVLHKMHISANLPPRRRQFIKVYILIIIDNVVIITVVIAVLLRHNIQITFDRSRALNYNQHIQLQ